MKRFYRDVSVVPADDGFAVLLDGKPVKTPGREMLIVQPRALAEAIAEEWRGQGEEIDPAAMPLTKLANTAIDIVAPDRGRTANQILAYGRTDLLIYRAEAPQDLVARQNARWNPLLDWLAERYGARLVTGQGVTFVDQPGDALVALDSAVWAHDDFMLAALHNATTLMGSLVLALALAERRLDAEAAFAASMLDESFQVERWGRDAEAEARRERLAAELAATERFMRLASGRERAG